jgi:hypothetical protein
MKMLVRLGAVTLALAGLLAGASVGSSASVAAKAAPLPARRSASPDGGRTPLARDRPD